MRLWKGLRALLAFFTAIPVGAGEDDLELAAAYMPLSPIVGLLVGSLAGALGWLLASQMPGQIAGVLTMAALLFLTGLHHADGLLDFGDGLMCAGPPERKLEAMADRAVGSGGLVLGMTVFLASAMAISSMKPSRLLLGLPVAEAIAKGSMALAAGVGRPSRRGLGSTFIEAMRRGPPGLRVGLSLALTFAIAFWLAGLAGIVAASLGLAASLAVTVVSHVSFKGLTGDVFGAINEVSRMASLMGLVLVWG